MHQQHEPTNQTQLAALLAAEAAFAPPSQTAEQMFSRAVPTVTVLRAKRAVALVDSTDSAPSVVSDATAASEPQLPASKVPRVFLLKPADVGFGPTTSEPRLPREVQAEETGALLGRDGAAPSPVRPAKRRRNKPSPVTLVFSAITAAGSGAVDMHCGDMPAAQAQAQTQAQAQRDPPACSLTHLAAALAAIEPTLAAISAAMCFTVADPQVTAQWEHMSRALDQIAVEIRASLMQASAAA